VKIRAKILWTLLGMFLLVTLAGIVTLNRLQAAAAVSATNDARDVARLVGLLAMPGTNKFSESAQKIVAKLHQTQGRDVVLLNSDQIVVADSLPSRVGRPLTEDPADQVGMTIKDRQVRTFVEVGKDYPAGAKRIVVPVERESGEVIGAVVLRYTPLYDELMRLTSPTRGELIWAGCGSIAIALWLALYAGGSLVRPLRQLTIAATGFASGRTDLPMPRARQDEVGDLATAFTDMIHLRERAEDELRRVHDDDRVSELAKTNVVVSAGNAERMRAEETLRESEEKFRQLADHITDVFWITSADLATVHYVSPGYETTWGRSTESLYGDAQERIKAVLPEDRERVYAIFQGLMGNVPKVSVEYRIGRPDGTVRWIHERGFQVRDAAGCLVGLNGIASDITESKQIEEALRQQQTELRVLIDLTPALICFKDVNNRILRVNQRFAEVLGRSVEEIEGKSIREVDPQAAEKVFTDDLQVIHSGTPKLGIIETILDREGRAISVQTDKVPVFDKDKKVIGIVVMYQDITQRKSAEETLRLLNSAVLQSRESIVITDAELDLPGPQIVFVNPAFTKMTGYAAEEVIGKTPRILQGPRTDQAVINRLRQDLRRGELFEGEAINYRKDGTEFTLEWQATPFVMRRVRSLTF
jgi:PAS domain S-box-containing protein